MRKIISLYIFLFLLSLTIVNAKLSIVDEQHTIKSYNKTATLFEKLSSLSMPIAENIYKSFNSMVASFRKLSSLESSLIQNNNTNTKQKVAIFRKLDRLSFTDQMHNSTSNGFSVNVTKEFCKGTIQLQSIDSNLNLVPFTNVFFNNSLKGATDSFGVFESKQRSVCGEMLSYTLKCQNNITCETKTTTLDFHRDFDSLSFDCSVCTGDVDLKLDINHIKTNKRDNKVAVNVTIINIPTTQNINITFKVQGNDGLISKEESQLFNISSNERFKFITQSIALTGDFVHVYVDPDNRVIETNEKNNYALVPLFEKQINAYLNISTGYENVDNKIKDYLKLFINEKPQNEADVTMAVGLPNKNTIINNKNSLTRTNYGWYFNDIIYYNNKPLGSKPYNGMVGAFSDDYNYIFVAGNDIDGLIAAIKRLISAKELFFSNLNKDKVSVIEDTDVAGIAVTDLLRNPSSFPYYEKRGTIMFANVVDRVLNDNSFEVDIKTVKSTNDNTTLRLKNINTDFSDNFKDVVIGNSKPVVLARGLWSNLFGWEDFGKELAFDKNNARDTWLIEITGGPKQDCPTCPNYEYEDLVDYTWPALITGVQNYSGQKTLDYIGFSNGCRVALDSLKNWSNSGKSNGGYVFDSVTGNYLLADLSSSPVSTFVGVGCPGAFEGVSLAKTYLNLFGNNAVKNFKDKDISHIKLEDVLPFVPDTNLNLLSDIEDTKISVNLFKKYVNFALETNDNQPGESISLGKLAIIHGSLLVSLNDGVVTLVDSQEIYNNISSGEKKRISIISSHSSLADSKIVENLIKKTINSEPFTFWDNLFVVEEEP